LINTLCLDKLCRQLPATEETSMADQSPDTADDEGTPRWVKVSGIVAAVVVVLVGIMLLTGHGPGRHFSHASSDMGGATGGMPAAAAAP
jgi:hypothetical protein